MIFFFLCTVFVSFASSDIPYWPKSFFITLASGSGSFVAESIDETSDNGFIVTGYGSNIGEGWEDLFLGKFFSNGSLEWGATLSGDGRDLGFSVQQTSDDGYVVTGATDSPSGGGQERLFIAKFYSNGSLEWTYRLVAAVNNGERGYSIKQTSDSGYIVTGYTSSYSAGARDVFLAKFDSDGLLEWIKTVGSAFNDMAYTVQETSDSGYIISGYTYGSGFDSFLCKFLANGDLEWCVAFGGSSSEFGNDVVETMDGGFVVAGKSNSFDGGGYDVTLTKFYPNGTLLWSYCAGGSGSDVVSSVIQTSDGFVVAGYSGSFSDYEDLFFGKFHENGTLDKFTTFGGKGYDRATHATAAYDGGFLISGYTDSFGDDDKLMIVKVDENGESIFDEDSGSRGFERVPDSSITISRYIHNDGFSSEYISSPNYFDRTPNFGTFSTSFVFSYIEDHETLGFDMGFSVFGECYGSLASLSVDPRDSNVCSVRGVCNNGTCDCDPNYYGLECEVNECNGLLSNDSEVCSGHGLCVDFNVCVNCTDDYFGELCGFRHYPSFFATFGEGTGEESGNSVLVTEEGGFISTGYTSSFTESTQDMLLTKFGSNGSLDWSVAYGGRKTESGESIQITSDGGFIIVGYSNSFSSYLGFVGGDDVFLMKLFSNGSLEWALVVGGRYEDKGYSVHETLDNGYIVCGTTRSFGEWNDKSSILVLKFRSNGTVEWGRKIGTGDDLDYGVSALQTSSDGGFLVAATSYSYDGVGGGSSILLTKFTSSGSFDWSSTVSGISTESCVSIQEDFTNGGFIVSGSTYSWGGGGEMNAILAKYFDNGDLEWVVTLGGDEGDIFTSVQPTSDGGYIATGRTDSFLVHENGKACILLAKFFSSGDLDWAMSYGGDDLDYAYSISETEENGYVITGSTNNFGPGDDRFFIYKLYKDGEGCLGDEFFIKVSATSNIVSGVFAVSETPLIQDVTPFLNFSFITPNASFITGDVLSSFLPLCSSEFACFGLVRQRDNVCGGVGNCTSFDSCTCDSVNYLGDECEITYCYDLLSNDTDNVCAGHGECHNFDNCTCFSNFEYVEDCSLWKCFDKWKNESGACIIGEDENNDSANELVKCTSHDFCTCPTENTPDTLGDECLFWYCDGVEHSSNNSSICTSRGNCTSPEHCACSGGYEGDYCQTWSCDVYDKDYEEFVCNGRGNCLSPGICECHDSVSYNGYHGMFCEAKVGRKLVHGTTNLLVIELGINFVEMNDRYLNQALTTLYDEFECNKVVKISDTPANEELVNNGVHFRNCTFSNMIEFSESHGRIEFLKIDISHLDLESMIPKSMYTDSSNQGMWMEFLNEGSENKVFLQLFPPFSSKKENEEKKQIYTLKTFSDEANSIDKTKDRNMNSPSPERQVCKEKLELEEICLEIHKCYETTNPDIIDFSHFSVGYMPMTDSDDWYFSKFYYTTQWECEEGKTFPFYKTFSLHTCFGSKYRDNNRMYERCSSNLGSLFFSADVIGYFVVTISPVYVLIVILLVCCCCCSFNLILFRTRWCLRKLKYLVKISGGNDVGQDSRLQEEHDDEEEQAEEKEEGKYNEDNKINAQKEIELEETLIEDDKDFETNHYVKMGEINNTNISDIDNPVEFEEIIEEEEVSDTEENFEKFCKEEDNDGKEEFVTEDQEDTRNPLTSININEDQEEGGVKDPTTIENDPMKTSDEEEKKESILKYICCCCCYVCVKRCCICDSLKCCLMVFVILGKEVISLWFSSSEFLDDSDIDTSNPDYILLRGIIEVSQSIIWVSIGIYIFGLIIMIVLYVQRFMFNPMMFCVGFGSLKEYIYFRIFKSTFLLFLICINLFCYITKFIYLGEYERRNQLNKSSFYFNIIFPETLLIFNLFNVLSYNGVASYSMLESLKKLGIFGLSKFPRVNISYMILFKDPDVILDDFFQLLYLIEKKEDFEEGRSQMKELEDSFEYGHLNWNLLHGLDYSEVVYLKDFFFPKSERREDYVKIFHHHRIFSQKWLFAVLLFPIFCILGVKGV